MLKKVVSSSYGLRTRSSSILRLVFSYEIKAHVNINKNKSIIFASIFLIGFAESQAATITVNTTSEFPVSADDGYCMLNEAVAAANSNVASGLIAGECQAGDPQPSIDVISFSPTILPAYITPFAELLITESVHIKGPGRELLNLQGFSLNRVFKIQNTAAAAEFTLSDMTFSFSGIILPFADYGGAILASHVGGASLTLERLHFLSNSAEKGGGALALFGGNSNTTLIKDSTFENNFVASVDDSIAASVAGGGAIFIGGYQSVEIDGCTFVGNSAANSPLNNPLDDAAGGAVLILSSAAPAASDLVIKRSTFSNNRAVGVGAGLAVGGPGFPNDFSEVIIRHSTWTLNEADSNNDQPSGDRGGGGIYTSASTPVNLFNSIVAENLDNSPNSAPDLTGVYNTLGFNLIGNNLGAAISFPAGLPNGDNDTVGSNTEKVIPQLMPLADNGGPTLTHQLMSGSPAVDQGKCDTQSIDQRHFQNDVSALRTIDQPAVSNLLTGCDIGAVELGSVSENAIPDAQNDSYMLLEGTVLVVNPNQGLLANDVDDDALTILSAGSFNSTSANATGLVTLIANGAFSFSTDDPDAFGTATFTYTVTDFLNSSTADVTLSVIGVNDPPAFNATQLSLSAAVNQIITIPAWATDIITGPANEADQTIEFLVQELPGNPGFFAQLPQVNSQNGELKFQLSSNATGQSSVRIALRDSGGTANGGDNTSALFTLNITASLDLIFKDGYEIN